MKQRYSQETEDLLLKPNPLYIKLFIPITLTIFALICCFLNTIKFKRYWNSKLTVLKEKNNTNTIGTFIMSQNLVSDLRPANKLSILLSNGKLLECKVLKIEKMKLDNYKAVFTIDKKQSEVLFYNDTDSSNILNATLVTDLTVFDQFKISLKKFSSQF